MTKVNDMPTQYYFDSGNLSLEVNGEKQTLPPIVSRLLDYFLTLPGTVISRKTLAIHIWQSEHVSDDAINRCISLLRKVLGGESNRFVKTIKQRGYVFNVPDDVVFHRVASHGNIVEQTMDNIPELSVKRLKWPALMVIILTFLVFVSGWSKFAADEAPDTEKAAISLMITPIKTSTNQALADDLTDRLLFAISKGNQFTLFTAANTQRQTAFTLETTMHSQQHGHKPHDQAQAGRLAVRLINNESQRIVFSTSIELSDKSPVNATEQIAAAIRIVLLHGEDSQYYLNEYPKLSYIEIETLSDVSEQIGFFTPQSFKEVKQTLTDIYQQNPDSAKTAGLLSRIYFSNIETYPADVDKVKEWADIALSLDSINYDALNALFGYHIYSISSRDKALPVLNRLERHYPNRQVVWHLRLGWMIVFSRPCSEFEQMLERIPKSTFEPHYIEGIKNILELCQAKTDVQTLIAKAQEKTPEHMEALWYNLYLFDVRHPRLLEGYKYLFNQSEDPVIGMYVVLIQLMLNDTYGAKQTVKQHNLMEYAQTKSIIKPIAQLHQMPWSGENTVFDLTKSNISEVNAIYQAAAIIKQAQKDQNLSNLNKYIGLHSNFEVNIANRYPSIALIAALHFSGDVTQSQRLAKRLYFGVDKYRREHPQSYRFWRLGWFQIVSSKYCGQPCILPYAAEPEKDSFNASAPNGIFSNLFAEGHLWWTDDLVLSRVFLSPWLDDPDISHYLHLIEQDINQFNDYSAD